MAAEKTEKEAISKESESKQRAWLEASDSTAVEGLD
jgi:hypothetical protein